MIVCGWCGATTADGPSCAACSHPDPRLPWEQRGREVPTVADGKPSLNEQDIRRRYAEATRAIREEGRSPTVEAIAEKLDRSPRTVREWRQRFGLR